MLFPVATPTGTFRHLISQNPDPLLRGVIALCGKKLAIAKDAHAWGLRKCPICHHRSLGKEVYGYWS